MKKVHKRVARLPRFVGTACALPYYNTQCLGSGRGGRGGNLGGGVTKVTKQFTNDAVMLPNTLNHSFTETCRWLPSNTTATTVAFVARAVQGY